MVCSAADFSFLRRVFRASGQFLMALGVCFCACGETATPVDPFGPAAGTAVLVEGARELLPNAPRLRLTMVDVGQGDGMVLELPGGAVVALDGGPDRTGNYSNFVASLQRMDYVILSHSHSDHYTGLPSAVALLPKDCAARVYDPGYDRTDIGGYQYFKSVAGCRYSAIGAGMSLGIDADVAIAVVGADSIPYPSIDGTGINNTSLVTYVRYGNFTALFTGDEETEGEQRVFAAYKDMLRANVLKIGHHGSCNATGTSYLRAVHPDVALISAASANDFGHPHCQTLAKLRAQGTHWYRTDKNGSITVETDGQHYTVSVGRGLRDDADCPRNCAIPSDF